MHYEDLADHPFSPESVARESDAPSASDRSWYRWVDKVEALFGHDLDGSDVDQAGCGYSMDEGYEEWSRGTSPEGYVSLVKSRDRYVGEDQGL